MKKKTIIASIIIISAIGAMAWTLVNNKKTIDSKKDTKSTSTEIAVTVTSVTKMKVDNNLKLVGTAEANRTVVVASTVSGNITQVNFNLGDFVKKGIVLAQVDDVYRRLTLESAQLNYDKCKEDYERYKVLQKGDAVTETQFRDIELAYKNASTHIETVKKQLADTQITAPYSGYITSKNVELGTHVNMGTAIAEIVDILQLRITLSVSESKIYALRTGQIANVSTSVYPTAIYKGTVSHISPQGDDAHTYPVQIVIPNSDKHPLKAGTYVNVEINIEQSLPMLMIPRDAIVGSVKDPLVYLVNGDVVSLKKITVGYNVDSDIEVLSGLNENDLVVTNGQINLMDGAKISIVKN